MELLAEKCVTITYRPGPSERGFRIGLYFEHLEEASFLYEQRHSLLDDPELTWRDLHDFESRFEAHIDALVVGGELALGVCKQQAIEGDFGELHAAVRVFCRQNRLYLLREVIDIVDPENADSRDAVRRALADELPDSWKEEMAKLFADQHPFLRLMVPYIFGYRRIDYAKELANEIVTVPPQEIGTIAWSLGRIRFKKTAATLLPLLEKTTEPDQLQTICLSLLRNGDFQCLPMLKTISREADWPHMLLGLCGSRLDVGYIHKTIALQPTGDALLALGMLGCSVSVNLLIRSLDTAELAEAASYALYLITGAPLIEEVFIPEPADEPPPEIAENEEAVAPSARQPPSPRSGITIKQISRQKEQWQAWWKKQESKFQMDVRYRNGRPFELQCLVDNIASEILPRKLRQLASEELLIRYHLDVPFETEMTVEWQLFSINHLKSMVDMISNQFEVGEWYLGGKIFFGEMVLPL